MRGTLLTALSAVSASHWDEDSHDGWFFVDDTTLTNIGLSITFPVPAQLSAGLRTNSDDDVS